MSNFIWQVSVFGDQIYAFTDAGISVSNNLGKNWVTVQDPLFGAKHITRDGGGDSNSCILFTGVFGGTSAPIVADTLGSANPWERKTTSDGLGSNFVIGVYKDASNGNVYAATTGGLGISTDGGVTFTNKTTADGLGGNFVRKVYAKGDDIYAATSNGLGISTDGGVTFTNKTTADGLGSDGLRGIAVIGNHVYVATDDGVSISDNGGSSFSNRTTADGLPSNTINQIAAFDFFGINYIYAATAQGLAVSSDEGLSWIVYNSGTPGYASGSNTSTVFVQEDYSGVIHIFAGTVNWGLSVSPDNGTTWTTYTNANTSGGLASDQVQGVSAGPNNNDIYVATTAGLSILSSGTWTTKNTTTAGLGSNTVFDVYRKDCRVFAATASGLSIADNYS